MNEKYVEDSVLTLPVNAEGLNGLGDLWDCHTSRSVGFNLFTNALNENHFRVNSINASDYSITHEKGTADKIKKLNVSGGIEIDFLAGFIKGGLDGLYDVSNESHSDEEKLNCHYLLHTHSVQLAPSAKEALDEDVKEKLIQGSIKATHVVSKVTFGAEINAVISIKEKNTERQQNIKGGFNGNLPFGKITAGLKASLQKLDSDDNKTIEKSITLYSKPPIGNPPSTISQMFEQLENAHELIKNEKPLKMFQNIEVIGVPLLLILVPIPQFLIIQIEKLYLQLTAEALKSFKEMMINLVDFQGDAYVKKHVISKEPCLSVILSDSNSPLSKNITCYESKLKENVAKHFQKCFEDFRKFKIGEVNEEILEQHVKDFIESEHSVLKVGLMIEEFLLEGRRELNNSHHSDAITLETDIEFITSHDTLKEWGKSQVGIRILVTTKNTLNDGAFRQLFDMSAALKKMAIRVGIVLPSISEDFSLQVNVYGEVKKYGNVSYILQIVGAILGTSNNTTETMFQQLKSSLAGIQLPLKLEELKDLNNAIDILNVNNYVKVASSTIETMAILRSEDEQWKFFVSLDCKNTAKLAVMQLQMLQQHISVDNANWIIGTLGISDMPSGPLVFVIGNGQVKAICFDRVDLLLLIDIFMQNSHNPNLEILSKDSLKHSLYPDQVNYAVNVLQKLNHTSSIPSLQLGLTTLASEFSSDSLCFLKDKMKHLKSLDCIEIVNLLHSLGSEMNAEQWAKLWDMTKFIYLIKLHVNKPSIINELISIQKNFGFSICPNYIPHDVRCHLLDQWSKEPDLPDTFNDLEEMMTHFYAILENGVVPINFHEVLSKSVSKNDHLRKTMQDADALLNWKSGIFFDPWDIQCIQSAINNIEGMKKENQDSNEVSGDIQIDLSIDTKPNSNLNNNARKNKIQLSNKWKTRLGEEFNCISSSDFVKIQEMLEEPKITNSEETGCLKNVLWYVLQNLKMWGGHILQPEHISSFLIEVDTAQNINELNDPFCDSESIVTTVPPKNLNRPISRLDILVVLLSALNCADARHTLRVISSFPLTLPLVIPDIQHDDHFLILLQWLMGCTIKWEPSAGLINENHLFINPFKMIVAIRLGGNDTGKSTILNQLFNNQYMFSSISEPGSERGPPLALNGMVEVAYLTKETCKLAVWVSDFQKHYSENGSHLLLLANLHGDALLHQEILKFLDQIACCFIVFIMPDEKEKLKQKWEELKGLIKKKMQFLYVDPKMVSNKQPTIETKHLTKESTLKPLQNVLKQAIKCHYVNTKMCDIKLGRQLKMVEGIETDESSALIKLIVKKSCKTIKERLKLLTETLTADTFQLEKNKDSLLQDLLTSFGNIMFLSLEQRRNALEHIGSNLFLLFEKESQNAWTFLCKLQEDCKKNKSAEQNYNPIVLNQHKDNMVKARNNIDSMSLGLEHFFRAFGYIYEVIRANSKTEGNNAVLQMPCCYAELFLSGHVIELLNGDSVTIPNAWFTAIGDEIHGVHPDLTIYVISIIGLQSSGKSTLLNALFACNFASSVGRCTKGLFICLMFLNEALREKLKVDAVLLIDTEGLGAPERYNDKDAEQADRRMATFAIGMSNLTLINVLGESMSDLMGILQIAIVAMTRLEKAVMQPDILLVQHISERNRQKTSKADEQFVEALKNATELTERKGIECGCLNSKSLQNLMARIVNGDILKQFRPFKDGASVNAPPSQEYHEDVVDLFNSIIKCCENDKGEKTTFKKWYYLIQSYWEAVANENFASRFKNIQEMYESIERGKKIAKVKEFIRKAFQNHAENLASIMRKHVCKAKSDKQQETITEDDKLRNNFKQKAKNGLEQIPNTCNLKTGQNETCLQCREVIKSQFDLFDSLKHTEFKKEVEKTIFDYMKIARSRQLTVLMQMFDAEIVREGCSKEFMLTINNEVKKVLEERKSLETNEIGSIAKTIWKKLLLIAAPKTAVVSMSKKFDIELESEYKTAPSIIAGYLNGTLPDLSSLNAYEKREWLKKSEKKLEQHEVIPLYGKLHNFSENFLKGLTDAQHFQDGMIRDLREMVKKMLKDLEKDLNMKFLENFRWNCHLYALLTLSKKLKQVQENWDERYNPLKIVIKQENEITEIIKTRLQYGFNVHSDGRVAAMSLLSAIKKVAEKAAYRDKRNYILDVLWMTDSENVRLQYFSQIAEQVNSGITKLAVQHFLNPTLKLDKWFKKEVERMSNGKEMNKFKNTFLSELEYIIQKIKSWKTVLHIQEYIADYLSKVVDVHYNSGTDLKNITENDAHVFRESMLYTLNDSELKNQFLTNPTFMKPTEDEEILQRLGCTECCLLCGAICWGQKGHHEDSDSTRSHHSCHQPGGLFGVCTEETNELICNMCHERKDDTKMYFSFDGIRVTMPWLETKEHVKFNNWRYQAHCKDTFNDLMCWFFVKLHKELAAQHDVKPANEEEIEKTGWKNLKYEVIMSTINQKIIPNKKKH